MGADYHGAPALSGLRRGLAMPLRRAYRVMATVASIALASPSAAIERDVREAAAWAVQSGDYRKAIELLTPRALVGDAEAQYLLGMIYISNGDHKAGRNWITRSAVQEFLDAEYQLGQLWMS